MKKSYVLAKCECGNYSIYEEMAFYAIGAVISWCQACCPEQPLSDGDGGESPHHIVGISMSNPCEVYDAWKKFPQAFVDKDQADSIAHKMCANFDPIKQCEECTWDPCGPYELFNG